MNNEPLNQKPFQALLALVIFTGAFLLFFIQPLIASQLLPHFGGAASVWLACLLSFQTFLLLGYSYAHLLRTYCSPRSQSLIHFSLLALSLVWTWIRWSSTTADINLDRPMISLALSLSLSIGFPFILLSATSPLVQNWYGLKNDSPYRLYALSNIGSLLALLTYPVGVEPEFTISAQFNGWMMGLIVYLCLGLIIVWRLSPLQEKQTTIAIFRASRQNRLYWTALSACGAMILLTTTNVITREVAPIPLLWIPPLALYLLTFIICFDKPAWYHRPTFFSFFGLSLIYLIFFYDDDLFVPLAGQIFVYLLLLFTACMICHGEMVRRRPDTEQLTEFYLFLALGGVLGALLINVVAPNIFLDYHEYELTILATILLGSFTATSSMRRFAMPLRLLALSIAGFMTLVFMGIIAGNHPYTEIASYRDFYGVTRVAERPGGDDKIFRKLYHDKINHGSQITNAPHRHFPTTYFSYHSGIGVTMINHQKPNRKVGIIGLGVGVLATYANPGDQYRFYEINPLMMEIADEYFSFLADSRADIVTIEGDARLTLEHDQRDGYRFDIIVIDAFSGDSIPTHLLTEEAWHLYWQLLEDDGILAIHLSSKYIDLIPVVQWHDNQQPQKQLIYFHNDYDSDWDIKSATWLVQTGNQDFLRRVEKRSGPPPETSKEPVQWTDEKSAMWGLFD